jgi:RimJ/RimL family protein N-acetyltransferase
MSGVGTRETAHWITLTDGTLTRTRKAGPVDLGLVQALHRRCSPNSRALRYHVGKPGLSRAEWRWLSDPERGTALVTTLAQGSGRIIAMTNIMRTREQGVGELAILIEDAWQSKGLGTALVAHAAAVARRDGYSALIAAVAAVNSPMLRVLAKLTATSTGVTGPVLDLRIPLGRRDSRGGRFEPAGY